MADLRGGSTVGGRPIATTDMIEKIVTQEQITAWTEKMNRYESTNITTTEKVDSYMVDKNKNGIYQTQNVTFTANNAQVYGWGTLVNLSANNSRFQLYAPHKSKDETAGDLFFRTGWDTDTKAWERVVTSTMLNTEMAKKLNLTGGTLTGALYSNSVIATSGKAFIGASNNSVRTTPTITLAIGDHDTGLKWKSDGNFDLCANNTAILNIAESGVYVTAGKNLRVGNNDVWHTGNLTPSNYVAKSTQLSNAYDLNTLYAEGFYRVYQPTNRPSKIANWAYVEVMRHSDTYVMQKIYNYEGSLSYWRTRNNGTWTSWIPMGGGMTYVGTIATSAWTTGTNYYETTITHNLGSNNIVSVIFTDNSGFSMQTGFSVTDANKIKIYCSTNVAGKIVINATP